MSLASWTDAGPAGQSQAQGANCLPTATHLDTVIAPAHSPSDPPAPIKPRSAEYWHVNRAGAIARLASRQESGWQLPCALPTHLGSDLGATLP